MRRSEPDATRSDRGFELVNELLVVVEANSERVFNDAKTAQSRPTEMTLMWNRWRSTLFSWYPNAIAISPSGAWPWWSLRTITFYVFSVVLWLSYFYGFFRLRRSPRFEVDPRHPDAWPSHERS